MKFFLELVPCCVHRASEAEISPPPREEERSLVRVEGRRRRCPVAAGEEWKPSLSSISEEYVISEKVQKERKAAARRKSSAAAGHVRGHHCSWSRSNDNGRASITAVIPAFVPTPFMF